MQDVKALKYELKTAREALAVAKAEAVKETSANAVYLLDGFSMDDLRAFANAAKSRVGRMLVALSGTDGDYKYVIASDFVNLSEEMKNIKSALAGSGGGKSVMVQGSFLEPLDKIKAYFN